MTPAGRRTCRSRRRLAPLLHDGVNDLSIRLLVRGPIAGFLDRVWVGPDEAMRPTYDLRTTLFVTLPVVMLSTIESAFDPSIAALAVIQLAIALVGLLVVERVWGVRMVGRAI